MLFHADSIVSVSAHFQVHEVHEENIQTLDSISLRYSIKHDMFHIFENFGISINSK